MFNALRARIYNKKRGWEFVGATTEPVALDKWKHNYWTLQSRSTGAQLSLMEPLYGEMKTVVIYEAESNGTTIRYAMGEFTAGLYGFYAELGD